MRTLRLGTLVAAGAAFLASVALLGTGVHRAMESSSGTSALLVGLVGVLGFGAAVVVATARLHAPIVVSVLLLCGTLFAWLGWTFVELALDPPAGLAGVRGWYVSGGLLLAMGAAGVAAGLLLLGRRGAGFTPVRGEQERPRGSSTIGG